MRSWLIHGLGVAGRARWAAVYTRAGSVVVRLPPGELIRLDGNGVVHLREALRKATEGRL